MSETAVNETAQRIENVLQTLSDKLKALNEIADEGRIAPALPDIESQDIADELTDFKDALKKIRDERRAFCLHVRAQNLATEFDGVNELRRLAEVLDGLTASTADLNAQCEKLDRTRLDLKTFSESGALTSTLKDFSDKLVELGTCDEKIRAASDKSSAQLDNMSAAVNEQINKALDLEREFLVTCRELADTTKKLEHNTQNIDERQLSSVIAAVDSLYDRLCDKLNDTGTNSADTATEKFKDLYDKIAKVIFNDETRNLSADMKTVNFTSDESANLPPDVWKKIQTCMSVTNRTMKILKQVTQILHEAGVIMR